MRISFLNLSIVKLETCRNDFAMYEGYFHSIKYV